MKLFVFSALLAVALAKPHEILTPTLYAAAPLAIAPAAAAINTISAPLTTQYHSQDELGQYSYGYSGGLSAKSEIKSLDGITRGAYSYLDAEGKLQSVEYTADAMNGFRATASNMPVAPVETRSAPLPVQETAEVAKARADHMVAFEEAKVRAAAAPEMPVEEKREEMIESMPAEMPVVKNIAVPAPAPVAAIAAPLPVPVLRTIASPAFSYAYSAPTFGYSAYPYHLGYPYNFGFRSALPVPVPVSIATPQFIPQPIAETEEVARLRAEHLKAHAEAKSRV